MALFPNSNAPAKPAESGEREPEVPMPVGSHRAKVVFVKSGMTGTGKVRFGVKFEDAEGRTSWGNIVAPDGSNPKHTRMFYGTMAKLDVGREFIDAEGTTADDVANALEGASALVTVQDEEYQGKTYRKVTWIDADPGF